jgi:hypothetical protein
VQLGEIRDCAFDFIFFPADLHLSNFSSVWNIFEWNEVLKTKDDCQSH